MKVIIGKFSHEPFHALTKKDLSLIFKLVPKEWESNVSSVVLSSKILKKTKLGNAVEYKNTNKQLCLYSRGLVREEVTKQVLLTLAAIDIQRKGLNLDLVPDMHEIIKPYLDKFLKSKVI